MSLKEMLTVETITQTHDRELLQASLKELRSQPEFVDSRFEFGKFGSAIARKFREMAPGSTRLFGLGTQNHFMALRLQVKDAQHGSSRKLEYVATVYDPNATATHARTVHSDTPAGFADRSLQHWTGEKMMDAYLTDRYWHTGNNEICQMYPWPPLTKEQVIASCLATAGPQHPLAGARVEVDSANHDLLQACWAGNLKALPGGGPDRLLCVSDGHMPIGALAGYRIDQYESSVPYLLLQQGFDGRHTVYLVPANQLRGSTDPSMARSSQ